jgi:hypothetical protein
MRERLIGLILLSALALGGCIEKERYTELGAGRDSRLVESGDILIKSVFPRNPMIAVGGTVHLGAAVTDGAGKELESTPDDPVTLTYTSSDESIVRVTSEGNLYGERLGSAEITLTARKGNEQSRPVTVTATVTERNAIDVAELFFAPMQSYVDLGGERTIHISAVDYSGTATSLSEGTLTFELSNDNVAVTPEEIDLTPTGEAVTIDLQGLSKGFSFITPIYTIASASGDQTVRITGTPLVVQVKDSVETATPATQEAAGQYLSIGVQELDGYKKIKVIHYNRAQNELLYSDFHGSWNHSMSAVIPNAGEAAAMDVSPFDINLNQPMVMTMQSDEAVLWYQASQYGGWDRTVISSGDIVDENSTYPERQRLMDVARFRNENNTTQNRLHVAYADLANSRVCLASLDRPERVVSGSHTCIATLSPVHSVSLAINHTNGEPRLLYGTTEREVTNDDNTTTTLPAEIYYVTRQNGQLYRERIAGEDKITSAAASAVLKLDRNNRPYAALSDGRHVRIFYREYVSSSGDYSWRLLPVDGIDPLPTEIRSLDLAIDHHNEPRLSFATVVEGEQQIRYARRPPFRGLGSRWVVESPGQNRDGTQGDYSAIAVDSTGRAHLVYSLDDTGWFNYWAEPNFFDYRNYPAAEYTQADVIGPQGALP